MHHMQVLIRALCASYLIILLQINWLTHALPMHSFHKHHLLVIPATNCETCIANSTPIHVPFFIRAA